MLVDRVELLGQGGICLLRVRGKIHSRKQSYSQNGEKRSDHDGNYGQLPPGMKNQNRPRSILPAT
jgi:hypothetical protein